MKSFKLQLVFASLFLVAACDESRKEKKSTANQNETANQIANTIDLALSNMSFGIDKHGDYTASVEIANYGNVTANNYDVEFEWRCPTDPSHVNYSSKGAQGPIKPGEKIHYEVNPRFVCKPRPIRIPCAFYVLVTKDDTKDLDTTNNKITLDYTLH